jgi:Tol biopolymer transport system component
MYRIILCLFVVITVTMNCHRADAQGTGSLAFISQRVGGVPHIFLENSAGTVTQLTSGSYPENSFSWSPDGTKIAFWRGEDGEGIYMMNADGSDVERLSPSPGYDIFPSWSPDGTELVFVRIIDPGSGPPNQISDIMTMDADGTNVQTILANNTFNMEPRWSPDGTKILFMSTLKPGGVNIYTMSTTGTNITELTTQGNNGDPSWSPDGTEIAFGSNRVNGKLNIFMMNANGSNQRQITNFTEPDEAGDTGWSPDGSEIAFEYDIGGEDESNPNASAVVETMNANGTDIESMGQQCSDVGCSPRWQP